MQVRIWIPMTVILGAIGWLAFTNFENANYFYSVDELPAMGDAVYSNSVKVKGRIVPGSISKEPLPVKFVIEERDAKLAVHYVSDEPLPDMFKDHAETVVEGHMRADGVFEAVHLQAKCASKYEAAGPQAEHPDSVPISAEPTN